MSDDDDANSAGREPSAVTAALSKWAFPVTGVLAIVAMTAVFFIAFRDQILGIDRWCYRHGRGLAEGSVDPNAAVECRDDQRSCELSQKSACRDHRASWVGPCVRGSDASASGSKTDCGAL